MKPGKINKSKCKDQYHIKEMDLYKNNKIM